MLRRELIAAGLLAASSQAASQANWPVRPIRLVVPFPPGGLIDRMARLLTPRLAQELGQAWVVDNRPGAAGNLGAADVSRAPADGHHLLMASPPLTISPAIYSRLPYAPDALVPVAMMGRVQNVLLVPASSPIRSVAELSERARQRPGQLNYASNGSGTSLHMGMALYLHQSGLHITHVPYRGSAAAMTALLASEVDVMFDNLPGALPHIRAGSLRALAVSAGQRSLLLPDVPTMEQAGVSGFELSAWFGLAAPAATPAAVLQALHLLLQTLVSAPDMAPLLQAQGAEPYVLAPSDLQAFWANDRARWQQVAQAAGIALE